MISTASQTAARTCDGSAYPAEVLCASLLLVSFSPDLRVSPTPAPTPTARTMATTAAMIIAQISLRLFG